ncbi:MAG: Fe-S cluster assembly protein SufD, partial [Planctomycetes bacterium]|nr:Fe-S cluster assembly protein SufD [Planctomycetota bacterium]
MSAVAVSSGFTAESFDAFIAVRNEPVWLKAIRRAAWNQFLELPLPSRREEEWMRTDIRLFKLDKFAPAGQPQTVDSA